MWAASHGLHHVGCITWPASRGLHHMGCITWAASCGLHHMGCIMWAASHGLHSFHIPQSPACNITSACQATCHSCQTPCAALKQQESNSNLGQALASPAKFDLNGAVEAASWAVVNSCPLQMNTSAHETKLGDKQSNDVRVDTKLVSRLMWFLPCSLPVTCIVKAAAHSGKMISIPNGVLSCYQY